MALTVCPLPLIGSIWRYIGICELMGKGQYIVAIEYGYEFRPCKPRHEGSSWIG